MSSRPLHRLPVSEAWIRRQLYLSAKERQESEGQTKAQAAATRLGTEPLLSYIPRVSPKLKSPIWLRPYVELLELAMREPIRAVVAAPPQCGKTETTTHALVRAFRTNPGGRSAYATYGALRTHRVEGRTRLIAERDGLQLEFRQSDWLDRSNGGSLLWTSRGGGFTGDPVDTLLVIDDLLKDRQEAESPTIRRRCDEWFDEVAEPRCHKGASILVMMTRWHPADLPGVLIARGWQYINLKALADGGVGDDGRVVDDPLRRRPGESINEDMMPAASLEAKRRTNIYSFASLYQGEPRPRGGVVFGEATYYDELPKQYRVGYGVDLAYTAKTSADFSVCVEGRMVTGPDKDEDGKPINRLFITDVRRAQVDAPSFTLVLHSRWRTARGPMRWYCATSEKGAGQFVEQKIPGFQIRIATADKFVRATPVAAAWNAGRVLVPREAPWLDDFLGEVLGFVGNKDPHDDQVDALAALWDVLVDSGPVKIIGAGGGTGRGWSRT